MTVGKTLVRRLPLRLIVVASLLLSGGVQSAERIITGLFTKHANIELAVFELWIGIGLLRLNARALSWARIVIVVLPMISILLVLTGQQPDVTLFGIPFASSGPEFLVFAALTVSVTVWELRVLKRADIVQLFHPAIGDLAPATPASPDACARVFAGRPYP